MQKAARNLAASILNRDKKRTKAKQPELVN